MNWLSERTERRRSARASVVLGWAFLLIALASCCWPTPGSSAAAHDGPASAAPSGITLAVQVPAARVVVADAPRDRGAGSSCHGDSEHSDPVVVPGQPAPAALPSAAPPLHPAPLTGAAAIRGPSNDAVGDVDRLRLQVQRI
ncbi:hypothetical protein [Streptomyces poriferorum]|uniref:Lipoprotein n=1 Tax=Streptomyces poriferorum TaxID=2798799 RepID=A0ABY9IIH8_9ACTN|nr:MULTISPECIES: hypothetical protein [unclassified Streptomyces]MDP5316589.1 hypothetical protein [Streptomyces sp. Alt4]WLQ54895.1 hypothetical protein P8A19_05335 [Streptomyces sp. Alt2]